MVTDFLQGSRTIEKKDFAVCKKKKKENVKIWGNVWGRWRLQIVIFSPWFSWRNHGCQEGLHLSLHTGPLFLATRVLGQTFVVELTNQCLYISRRQQ